MYASMPQLLQGSATLFLFSHIQILLFTYIYIGKYITHAIQWDLNSGSHPPPLMEGEGAIWSKDNWCQIYKSLQRQ